MTSYSSDAILSRLATFGSSSVEPRAPLLFFLGGMDKPTSKPYKEAVEQTRVQRFRSRRGEVRSAQKPTSASKKRHAQRSDMRNNVELERVSTEKDVGVNITNSLTWNAHIHAITAKANKLLGLLKRTCPLVNDVSARRTCPLVNDVSAKLWNYICKFSPPTSFSTTASFRNFITEHMFQLLLNHFDIYYPCTWSIVRSCPCHP